MSPFLFDWLFHHAARSPNAPFLGTPEGGWQTYGDAAGRVGTLAAALANLGVVPGTRVATALANVPVAALLPMAVNMLGATSVELGLGRAMPAVTAALAKVQPRLVVVASRHAAPWAPLEGRHRFLFVDSRPPTQELVDRFGDRYAGWVSESGEWPGENSAPAPAPVRTVDFPAQLVFTSGTTAQPIGVIQTHSNISANAHSIVEYLQLQSSDRASLVLPLSYAYGKSVFTTHLLAGGSVFLDERMTFPRLVVDGIKANACTGFAGVPLTFELLRKLVDVRAAGLESLRYVTQAGGAMAQPTIDWVRAAFSPAPLYVMYGQTEATARLSYLPPERAEEKKGSVGHAVPGVELRIVDDEGRAVSAGSKGHLVARGANVTPGYFEDPEATAKILRDGWLWTGDLGAQDADGFVFLHGRSREMLKLAGHRVAPEEIETVLQEHPSVKEAAVVGVPDDEGGEKAVAFVSLEDGATGDVQALQVHCRATLPRFLVPARIVILEALPRTQSGKVSRDGLRASAREILLVR
jgi:acyl-coenzyme A synthetase/AMP-(fatty) acid ligase